MIIPVTHFVSTCTLMLLFGAQALYAQQAPPDPRIHVVLLPVPEVPVPLPTGAAAPSAIKVPERFVDPIPLQKPTAPLDEAGATRNPNGESFGDQVRSWWTSLVELLGFSDQPSPQEMQKIVAQSRNPVTGAIALESAPMQCSVSCSKKTSDSRRSCGAQIGAGANQGTRLLAQAGNCLQEAHADYSACLVSCGLDPLPPMKRYTESQRAKRTPALGSSEELAQRRAEQ
jgi:hypothetical protein